MTGRGPNKDRTRPISCSATLGVGSGDRTLSSSDRTLSEAVIGRTSDNVYRHGSVFSVTRRSRLDDRTHEVQRHIESREVLERRNVDRTRQMVSDRTRQRVRSTVSANGQLQQSGRPDASDQDDLRVRSMAEI